MLAPCGSRTYVSCTYGYVWCEITVVSSRPSSAHSLSVWMSRSTCWNSKPRVSTRPAASAQNMNASSASGLCPRRISMRRGRLAGRSGLAAEEQALEVRQDLLAGERRDAPGPAVLLVHAHVVLERGVCRLERVVEFVALEDIVVGTGLVARAMLRVDGASDGPDAAAFPLDPEDD